MIWQNKQLNQRKWLNLNFNWNLKIEKIKLENERGERKMKEGKDNKR